MTLRAAVIGTGNIGRIHATVYQGDRLATLVAVVTSDGSVLFANSALEDALGISRRAIEGSNLPHCFTEPHALQNAQRYFRSDPSLAIYPGVLIALTVAGVNFVGDGLRDALDPRLRGQL